MALLSQADTTVRGAYEVMVSMTVLPLSCFSPLFRRHDSIAKSPGRPGVRRVPGGKPLAIALASLGLACTLVTIALSIVPSADDPDKLLAIAKVVGGMFVLVGAGVVVFIGARLKARREAKSQLVVWG